MVRLNAALAVDTEEARLDIEAALTFSHLACQSYHYNNHHLPLLHYTVSFNGGHDSKPTVLYLV